MTRVTGAEAREFRLDINGLRAWAVVAVVLYHFGVAGIGGGFAGVDIFFVISGYLMCGIICSGLERDDFSVWRFYLARARRIFPALIVLCLVALVFGWFFLMPEEYKQLGKHARESLTFSSNLRYFDESGYFDVASREKWLLHTWSLSVEWQFYLILPLILMLQGKLLPGRRATTALLGGLFAVSLGLCLWRTSVNPSEAFYLIQTRAWEMLAGALVFMCGARAWSAGVRRALELLGFALILGTALLLDKHSVWPGWRAILPVAGSALVLLAARERSLWTTNVAAQWLGTRSYSIYLWHWPLVVALAYLERLDDPLWVAPAVLVSLLLGHSSYMLVEVPARQRLSRMSAARAGILLVVVLAVSATVAQQVRRSGFPDRLPEAVAVVESERLNYNPRLKECFDPAASCIYGEEPVRAIIIGDSHADAVVTALQAALPDGRGGVLFRGGSGCPIIFGLRSGEDKAYCVELNRQLEKEHAGLPAGVPIVMMGRTSEYLNGGQPGDVMPYFNFGTPYSQMEETYLSEFRERYVTTMCRLAEHRPLYLVRPTPEMGVDVPTRLGRAMLLGQERHFNLSLADYHKRHAFVWSMQDEVVERCGARILDPLPYLCADGYCPSAEGGRPIYRDGDHFSEFGNRRLVPMFRQVF
ncbi:acyltransferase family protein [Aquipseudomonas alcaligenes]|uniref:acyltransferase family protein n=1 Tax=Aquipseudomonas alcaligenes TaxID=43263 RepID=UPI0035B3A69C